MYIVIFIILTLIIAIFIILIESLRYKCTLQEFKNVDTKDVSFSLTTIPSRIEHIEPNIISLLLQNPNTIYLNIPYIFEKTGEKYIIPKWMDKYIDNGKITLIRTKDKGPATKFLGLLDHNIDKNEYIIIIDDDHIYNNKLLTNLYNKIREYKEDVVIGTHVDKGFVTGYSGYIFKRKLLDNINNFMWPKECYYVDDIWITNYFKYNNIPIKQLFDIYIPNISIEKSPNNIIEFLKLITISNDNLITNSYRSKVQEIDALYKNRYNKNLECEISLKKLLK